MSQKTKIPKIGIAGVGIVGGTVKRYFEEIVGCRRAQKQQKEQRFNFMSQRRSSGFQSDLGI